jgi:glucosyl-3-phosphoglycerate synthase
VPTREEAATLGPIVEVLVGLRDAGLVDQVTVVDAASADGTPELAARLGAEVHQEADLLPAVGPVLGKGDAMWRALSVLSGEVICFVDADSRGFADHFVRGLVGPLLCDDSIDFVKGAYRRPFSARGVSLPDEGGRVTELTARPLLNRFYPELAGFRQPLAGEMAARRSLLERLAFPCNYAVEIGLLLGAHREVGIERMAQVDLGTRLNRHQPLSALAQMAYSVLQAVALRLEREGRLAPAEAHEPFLAAVEGGLEPREIEFVERPAFAELRGAAAAEGDEQRRQ